MAAIEQIGSDPLLVFFQEADEHPLEVGVNTVKTCLFSQGFRVPIKAAFNDLQLPLAEGGELVFLQVFQKAQAGAFRLEVEVLLGQSVGLDESLEIVDKLLALGFEGKHFLVKEIKRFLVLHLARKMILLVLLKGFLREEFLNEFVDVACDLGAFLVVELQFAEVSQDIGQETVVFADIFSDFFADAFGDGVGYLVFVDADVELGG